MSCASDTAKAKCESVLIPALRYLRTNVRLYAIKRHFPSLDGILYHATCQILEELNLLRLDSQCSQGSARIADLLQNIGSERDLPRELLLALLLLKSVQRASRFALTDARPALWRFGRHARANP